MNKVRRLTILKYERSSTSDIIRDTKRLTNTCFLRIARGGTLRGLGAGRGRFERRGRTMRGWTSRQCLQARRQGGPRYGCTRRARHGRTDGAWRGCGGRCLGWRRRGYFLNVVVGLFFFFRHSRLNVFQPRPAFGAFIKPAVTISHARWALLGFARWAFPAIGRSRCT